MTEVRPEDFGAAGDGQADDADALQAAIDASIASRLPLRLGARVYGTSRELCVCEPVQIIGTPQIGWAGYTSRLAALAPMRSVLYAAARIDAQNLALAGNRKAQHGLWAAGIGQARFVNLRVGTTRSDGIHLVAQTDAGGYANNDQATYDGLRLTACGTLWCHPELTQQYLGYYVAADQIEAKPAAATVQAGSRTAQIEGVDLAEVGIRAGDWIRVGDQARMLLDPVDGGYSVSDAWSKSADSKPAALGTGDGYHEIRHGDNNLAHVRGGLSRNCVGYALAFDGLYGPRVEHHQVDYCPGWAVRVGTRGHSPVYCMTWDGGYFEGLGERPFLLAAAQSIEIRNAQDLAWKTDPATYAGGKGYSFGNLTNAHGTARVGAVQGTPNQVPASQLRAPYCSYAMRYESRTYYQDGPPGYGWPKGKPLDPWCSVVWVHPQGDVREIGAVATAGKAGQWLLLGVRGGGTLVLTRSASLAICTESAVMHDGDTVQLMCDGSRWVEIGRQITEGR